MKKFFSHFMTALAGLSSLTTLVSFAYYWNTQKFSLCASVIIGSVILLICIGYAIWQIVPKNSLSLTINEILNLCNNSYIAGLSILGGEPLHNKNIDASTKLAKAFKEKYPDKSVWIWECKNFIRIMQINFLCLFFQ